MDNQLTALQAICVYDKHIGRLNCQHQTPLGLAKFHNAVECRDFLEKHYRMVEVEGGRNEIGEIWWDRDLDQVNEDWKVVVGFLEIRSTSIRQRAGAPWYRQVTHRVVSSKPTMARSYPCKRPLY